jgi:hypothetical protein
MAAKPEIVAYLRQHLKQFPIAQLRGQLAQEGVSDMEFDAALKEAKVPLPVKKSGLAAKIFLAGGLAAVIIAALVSLSKKPDEETSGPPSAPTVAPSESGYVGHYGYVVRLPKEYTAVQNFKDDAKTVELVYFCRAGTDPTQFLNEGLYGQLGIVRLRVEPLEFTNDLNGLAALTHVVTSRAVGRGEKYTLKNIQISSMRGIQLNYDMPDARVEAFILGDKVLYIFMAGAEDATYRDILNSLRDANSET